MVLDVFDDAIFNRPFEKIELANGRLHVLLVVVGDRYSFPAAKGVQAFFTIRLQFEFVVVVDFETIGVMRTIGQIVDGVIFFGIVGDKPVDDAERNLGFAVDNANHFVEIAFFLVKLHQMCHQ